MTMRLDRRGVLALMAGCAMGARPSFAEDITVAHHRGTTTIPSSPTRVVTFDLATLDTLTALGVPIVGVPRANVPGWLGRRLDPAVARVGTLFEPDYEAVQALHPDLIVVASRSSPKYDALARIAPTLDMSVDDLDPLRQARDHVRALATLFGKVREAESALADLDARIAGVRTRAATAGRALVLLTTGGRISAYGPGSRFGTLHTIFGFSPVDPDLKPSTHGQAATFEYVMEKNPDWIFVIDRDAVVGNEGPSAVRLLDNDLVRLTNAAKNGRIVQLDASVWYLVGEGLTAMKAAADQVDHVLSAETRSP